MCRDHRIETDVEHIKILERGGGGVGVNVEHIKTMMENACGIIIEKQMNVSSHLKIISLD